MTVGKAILANVQQDASADLIEKALADVQTTGSVDVEDDYESAEHKALVDLASIEVLSSLLTQPDVTEGGLSLKYDRKAMQARIDFLQVRQGIYVETGLPTIEDISNLW